MVIILILFLLTTLIIFLLCLFRLVKWILKKKIRIRWSLIFVGGFVLAILIHVMFFRKMEWVQSKVYPNLYLLKHPIDDRDSINRAIREMVLQKINKELMDDNGSYDFSKKMKTALQYKVSFYEYYKTSGLIPFGEAGTAHFIDNEEDPGGFSSELLVHYDASRIAEFSLEFCKHDSLNYFGIINYYQKWDVVQTDTILNQCLIIRNEEPSETASEGN